MKFISKKMLICLIIGMVLPMLVNADKLSDQRQAFLTAQTYLNEKNDAGFLTVSTGLSDYVLYPYLRYHWLKTKLADTQQVVGFLNTYKNTRYAPLLRAKWLDYLAEQQRWGEFFVNYAANDKSSEDCRLLWAQYQIDKKIQALTEAKRLWAAGTAAQGFCQSLFNELKKSALLMPENNWQRFEAAIIQKHVDIAKAMLPLLTGKDRSDAEIWLTLQKNPQLIKEDKYWQEKTERTGRLFAQTVKQLQTSDINQAMLVWDAKKANLNLDSATAEGVERRLGMTLLGEKDPKAYDRLVKVTSPDEEARLATVRAALVEQNWQHVKAALAKLTLSEKQQPQWQYWAARAAAETGEQKQADARYTNLAKDRSFYGFLAADQLKTAYQFAEHPLNIDANALAKLAEEPDFNACQEFTAVNLPIEARRQWHFAIKDLPKAKLMTAAKLAQQWQWHQIAITTLVKADYWDDFSIRFPLHYLADVKLNSEKNQLDAALIYGVMRQESMLDKDAVSGVGARGLMQLMPATAKTVAQVLQEKGFSADDLFNPDINIRYGSHYFRSLLDQYLGNPALAGAAYNAGPHRVQKWLPITAPVPADVWIDTIPYKETRKYVTSILSYAIIYQNQLKTDKLKLKELLAEVRPSLMLENVKVIERSATTSALPTGITH